MVPSTLKYLYSVEPVRMHFPAKQPCTNDTVCNAALQHCTLKILLLYTGCYVCWKKRKVMKIQKSYLLIYRIKSSENFFSCNLVTVMLFWRQQTNFLFIRFTAGAGSHFYCANVRCGRKSESHSKKFYETETVRLQSMERLVEWRGLVISSRRQIFYCLWRYSPGEGGWAASL